MSSYREEEDPFEEDIVFDQAGLLNSSSKMSTAIRRVSSGKCVLFAKTLGLCGAFFGLGLCIAIPGPTFLSPLMELESSLSPISNIYVARTSGYIVGSIIGGVLFDRFNRLFLLFLSLLLTAVFITITPWCQTWVLGSCMIILGITMGFLDTGGNVLCLDLWGRNSGPFMQALHFSFGLGAIVAPLLAVPFLEPTFPNSTSNAEFTLAITEFPVHREEPPTVLYHDQRLRRDVETLNLVSNSSDGIKNMSNASTLPDNPLNVSGFSTNSFSPGKDSSFQTEVSAGNFSNLVSTPNTSVKPRIPKHKPSKIDASKLGYKNYDKVHVGKPPASDLLPLSTSSALSPLMSSVSTGSATSNEGYLSSATFSSSSSVDILSSLPVTSIPEHGMRLSGDRDSTVLPATVKNYTFSSPPTPVYDIPSSIQNILPFALENEESTAGSSSLTSKFAVSSGLEELFAVLNGLVKNTTEKINNINLTDLKNDDSHYLSHKNQDKYQSPFDIPFSSQQSYLHQRENNMNVGVKYEDKKVVNNPPLKTLSSNPISVESISNVGSSLNILGELSVDETRSGKDQLLDEKEQITDLKNNENLSYNSDLISSLLNHNTESSGNDKHMQSVNTKPSNENILFQKNEILSTYNSVPSTSEVHLEVVSVSPLESGLSTVLLSAQTSGHTHHMHHKPGTFDNDTEHINTIFDIFANRIQQYGFNKIQFSYLIVGIFVFLISLVFLGFLCHNPRDPKSKQEGEGGKKETNKVVYKLFIALMALFFFLYMGLEVTYGQLILTFTKHNNDKLAQSTGSLISVVFWGSFAAMRFASVFFASGFSPVTMLMLNFAFCTIGTVIVLVLANYLETALWVGSVLIGIGLASMFPTGILWIEQYIHITNKVSAVFVIGVALGEMICPVTIYQLMVIKPVLFMYAALVINIVCIFIFASLWWLATRQGEKYCIINNNGYELANQHDEEEDMMDMSGSGVMPRRRSFSSEHRSLLNGNVHRES